jgi:hypothetical protein
VKKKVLYCHCAYAKVVPPKVKNEVLSRLAESERDFEAVPDLCEMSARKDPALAEYAADADLSIIACYPRAVRWLFHAAGRELAEDIEILNMREDSADELAEKLGLETNAAADEAVQEEAS